MLASVVLEAQPKIFTLPFSEPRIITNTWEGYNLLSKVRSPHKATDYAASQGTQVRAVADGWAIASAQLPLVHGTPILNCAGAKTEANESFGLFVLIQHPQEPQAYSSLYAHLDSVDLPNNKEGVLPPDDYSRCNITGKADIQYRGVTYRRQWVKQGQVIGTVGKTGSKATHLHFEVAKNNSGSYGDHTSNRVDPYGIRGILLNYPPRTECLATYPYLYLWTQCPPVAAANGEVSLPICTLSVSPITITQGQSSTLTWTTTRSPTNANITGVGAVNPPTAGSRVVTASASTTYVMTVTNATGVGTCSTTLTVNPINQPPTAGFLMTAAGVPSVTNGQTLNGDSHHNSGISNLTDSVHLFCFLFRFAHKKSITGFRALT